MVQPQTQLHPYVQKGQPQQGQPLMQSQQGQPLIQPQQQGTATDTTTAWTATAGRLDSVEWNGGLEWWNGLNGNKLDTSDWFSPPYRPPLNKDHL